MPNNKVLNSEQNNLSRLEDFDNMTLEEKIKLINNITNKLCDSIDKMFGKKYIYILN